MIEMKKKALFLIILLFSFNFQFVFSATDEGYGEDQTALGQFVDSFENSNNITVIDDLIVNATLDCVELNYTGGGGVKEYENFSSYVEFEEAGDRITFFSDYNVSLQYIRNVDTRLYQDYGTGFFDVFEWEYEMYFTANLALNAKIWFMLSNYTTNAYTQTVNHRRYLSIIKTRSGAGRIVDVVEGKSDGGQNFLSSGALGLATWYYNSFKLNSSHWELSIYSNSLRTILVERISVPLAESKAKYRYLVISSLDSGIAVEMTGYIRNLWLGNSTSGYETDGYFITDDYLNHTDCDGSSLVLMTNTTIPANTGIKVEFSQDNSTWVNKNGIAGGTTVQDGFESYDLRDLNYTDIYFRFNFTSTDSSVTPRLYQARLISTIGVGGAGPSGGGAIGLIMLILICSPFILLVVWRSKRR